MEVDGAPEIFEDSSYTGMDSGGVTALLEARELPRPGEKLISKQWEQARWFTGWWFETDTFYFPSISKHSTQVYGAFVGHWSATTRSKS